MITEIEVGKRYQLTSNSYVFKPDSLPRRLPPEANAPDKKE